MLLLRWGEFMLCAALPRAVPMADGFLPFQGVGSAKRGDWEYTYIIGCQSNENIYTLCSLIVLYIKYCY